ncbi:uncharacterized protein LOC133441063 [Cololabis saira]|uniref:uncharacterized protein LOC133441063 n=1 Tax=Cololabis saira TaxID=129043 RepID=UPI002AD20565|nr:uncharacterized protein LOC133441063 [Cololabis saira]
MLCLAAVSAAAGAVWLLAMLGPGLSLPAEPNSEPDFTLCGHCFYRQTPPRGPSAGPPLHPHCHKLPGGQTFATMSRPTCDTAVYSAFHLNHGWTEREGEEGEGLMGEEEGDGIKVAVPALLRGDRDPSHPVSSSGSPLQQWDSTVAALVQSSIIPQCSSVAGDIYVLTGAGGLRAAEDGDHKCQARPLWSAVCCALPEGKGGFSVGLIHESEKEESQVSLKELEQMLGMEELFFGGCGGGEGVTFDASVGLRTDGLTGNTDKNEADAADLDSENTGSDANEDVSERKEASAADEQAGAADTKSENADVELSQQTTTDAITSMRSSSKNHDDHETFSNYRTVMEEEIDSNSTSALVYILSTSVSILKVPLRPVFSTITELPGQVLYILQEDFGVLSALPGDTVTLFHLIISDTFSWTGSAAEMLLGIGETSVSSVHYCTSSMLGALLSNCQTGVTGIHTLAGDSVGIFCDALDNAWSVTKFFGGRLWEQSEGYVGTVMSEIGSQAQSVGGGFGRLAWRSGKGMGNVFRMAGSLIMGMIETVFGGVRERFGLESE